MTSFDSIASKWYFDKLRCVYCHASLSSLGGSVKCDGCGKLFEIDNAGVLNLLLGGRQAYSHVEPQYQEMYKTARRVTWSGLEHLEFCQNVLVCQEWSIMRRMPREVVAFVYPAILLDRTAFLSE